MTNSSVKNILALVPNWLGDVVMCTPALRALHQHFPDAKITVAGRGVACDVLRGLPWLHHFEMLPARSGAWGMARSSRSLRSYSPDLAVVFPHSFRAALLARMSGARKIVGYARGGRSALLSQRVEPNRVDGKITPIYMVEEYLDLVSAFGCEYDGFGLELAADRRAVAAVREHLVGAGPFVGIAPGAAYGPSKRWSATRFAEVADELKETTEAQCVLLTGPGEEKTRDAVLDAAKYPLVLCDEGSPTIDSLKATISVLDLLVCNDSGPRHVAVAFDVPTVCVMGPTAPVYTAGPYERGRVLRVDVDCGPCQKPVCATDHRCMTRITPTMVVQAVLENLRNTKVKGHGTEPFPM